MLRPTLTSHYLTTHGLDVDDEVVLLDGDGEGLSDVGALHQVGSGLDLDGELPRLHGLGIAPGLAGANVELPAVPGAAEELAGARQAIVAGPAGGDQGDDHAAAQLGAFVRAAVRQGEVLATDVEEADLAAHHLHDLAGAGLNLARPRHHTPAHGRP